jgi:hypothetical protein
MAIENTYLLGKNITLGCGFDLQAKAPLDSRQVVPAYAGLQALIDGNAAYEGMIVYDEETKKTYQAQIVNDVLKFREFGINESELKNLIASETTAAMEFKGATASLPASGNKGDMYKVSSEFEVAAANDEEGQGFTAKVGDSIVYANTTYAEDGETVTGRTWYLVPSGDDIEDTWRPVTNVDSTATLTFEAGAILEKTVAANGTITYKHSEIAAPTNMNAEGDEQTRTYITQLITDNHGHIIGFKTATENVEDTNTTYTFEGQSDEATSVYFQVTSSEENASANVIYLDTYSKNEIAAIIGAAGTPEVKDDEGNTTQAAVPGTGIFANIYSKDEITALIKNVTGGQSAGEVLQQLDEYKTSNDAIVKGYEKDGSHVDGLVDKVDDLIAIGATKVEASSTNGNIKIDGVETTIYALEGEVYSAEDKAKLAGIEASAEVNVHEGIKLGSADSDVLAILENKTTVIPVASDATLGIVKSSTAENKVSVDTDGIMEVNSLNTNKLVQTAGEWLILNGGNASLSEAPTTEAE